jgi:flagellin
VIYTNMASQVAQKNLLGAQNALATSVERLSSGLRINRARDDAAGLSVANSLTSQINGANQGIRNLNDAISMVQTAEGAITAASDMGQRILTLATQAANNTLSPAARTAINNEMKELISAVNSIGSRTKYAGNSLLVNSLDAADAVGATPTTGTQFSMQISNDNSDRILLLVAAFRSIGTTGTDSDANGTDNGQATVLSAAIDAAGTANTADSYGAVQSAATNYVTALDTQRSLLGAYQNRLEYTLSNISSLSTNLTASRSRVIDTDYASETADLTRNQILQQAATAMLAQANQMPNVILTLLK